jgi:hypothetical protein
MHPGDFCVDIFRESYYTEKNTALKWAKKGEK